jgi:hypothetical protein
MSLLKKDIKMCAALLQEYDLKNDAMFEPAKLIFKGVGDKDVYNITAPFEDEGEYVIAGRVEARDSEHSQIMFFVEQDGEWVLRDGSPALTLQDPFCTRIDGMLVLGGVEIFPHPNPTPEHILSWRTVIYKGACIAKLERFFSGPDGMKDLRVVQMQDGHIGVFTRPQGEKGGRGKIGFTRIPALTDLTIELIDETPLLADQFADSEWGGANEIHVLSNGLLGVLGHIACYDEQHHRHYYPMVFVIHPVTGKYSDLELIAIRAKTLPGEPKRIDLLDVMFSGGIIRECDGTAYLYTGISDAESHRIKIPDPFLKYETLGAF